MTERNCSICRRPVSANEGHYTSHLRRHVREGVLNEVTVNQTELTRFQKDSFNWWGYVELADRTLVTVRSFTCPHSSMTVDRFAVGGVVEPGDSIRLEFRPIDKSDPRSPGMWFVEPLGYKADWL